MEPKPKPTRRMRVVPPDVLDNRVGSAYAAHLAKKALMHLDWSGKLPVFRTGQRPSRWARQIVQTTHDQWMARLRDLRRHMDLLGLHDIGIEYRHAPQWNDGGWGRSPEAHTPGVRINIHGGVLIDKSPKRESGIYVHPTSDTGGTDAAIKASKMVRGGDWRPNCDTDKACLWRASEVRKEKLKQHAREVKRREAHKVWRKRVMARLKKLSGAARARLGAHPFTLGHVVYREDLRVGVVKLAFLDAARHLEAKERESGKLAPDEVKEKTAHFAMRTCRMNSDGTPVGYNNYIWNADVGAINESTSWHENVQCGYGLHGVQLPSDNWSLIGQGSSWVMFMVIHGEVMKRSAAKVRSPKVTVVWSKAFKKIPDWTVGLDEMKAAFFKATGVTKTEWESLRAPQLTPYCHKAAMARASLITAFGGKNRPKPEPHGPYIHDPAGPDELHLVRNEGFYIVTGPREDLRDFTSKTFVSNCKEIAANV